MLHQFLSSLDDTDHRTPGNQYLDAVQQSWIKTQARLHRSGVVLNPVFEFKLKTRFGGTTDPDTWVRKD